MAPLSGSQSDREQMTHMALIYHVHQSSSRTIYTKQYTKLAHLPKWQEFEYNNPRSFVSGWSSKEGPYLAGGASHFATKYNEGSCAKFDSRDFPPPAHAAVFIQRDLQRT